MWSSYDGRFKLLDFGLTFHVDEDDLHQIQSPGYKAPETAEWNKYKDEIKKKRKRKHNEDDSEQQDPLTMFQMMPKAEWKRLRNKYLELQVPIFFFDSNKSADKFLI